MDDFDCFESEKQIKSKSAGPHKMSELMALHSQFDPAGPYDGLLFQLQECVSNIFKTEVVDKNIVILDATDCDLDTVQQLIENIIHFLYFTKVKFPPHQHEKINFAIYSLKDLVNVMSSSMKKNSESYILRQFNIHVMLNSLIVETDSSQEPENQANNNIGDIELTNVVVDRIEKNELKQSSEQYEMLKQLSNITHQPCIYLYPQKTLQNLNSILFNSQDIAISVSGAFVSCLAVQIICYELRKSDAASNRHSLGKKFYYDNLANWLIMSKKHISRHNPKFDFFSREMFELRYTHIQEIIQSLRSEKDSTAMLPEEDDLDLSEVRQTDFRKKICSKKKKIRQEVQLQTCPICNCNIHPKKYVMHDGCDHYICNKCSKGWFKTRNSCPRCGALIEEFAQRPNIEFYLALVNTSKCGCPWADARGWRWCTRGEGYVIAFMVVLLIVIVAFIYILYFN